MTDWSWARRRGARARFAAPFLVCALAAGVGSGLLAPVPARALPSGETWAAELAIEGGDDTNVVAAAGAVRLGQGLERSESARSAATEGALVLAPRRPAVASDRVAAQVTADVPPGAELDVSVRGTRSDGSWGEWTPIAAQAPAQLTEPAVELQVKITFVAATTGASPALQRLWLTADATSTTTPGTTTPGTTTPGTTTPGTTTPGTTTPGTTTPGTTTPGTTTPGTSSPTTTIPGTTPSTTGPTATPGSKVASPSADPNQPLAVPAFSTRVYATREGLVGGTTANGRRIVTRDRFAALPSRRGLSPNNTGDYTVVACAVNGRCAWAPVWDVGPWNTKDDYWNPSISRQSFQQLPQGLPESQAAYQGRFNGGRDASGRRVTNPSGIDLADGTFWDDLQLRDNSWVNVTFLWTGRGVFGIGRTPGALPVRSAPSSTAAVVGGVGNTARVAVACSATGSSVKGTRGTSNQWLRIGPGQFVPWPGWRPPLSGSADPPPSGVGRLARCAVAGAALAATATLVLPAEASAVPPVGETWGAELAVSGGDDVNVALVAGAVRLAGATTTGRAAGVLLLAPRRPAAPADTVAADLTADLPPGTAAAVDVRGVRPDGSWSGWIATGAGRPGRLPAPTTEVQARIRLLGAVGATSPAIQRLWLTTSASAPGAGTTGPTTVPPSPTAPSPTAPSPTAPSPTAPSSSAPSSSAPSSGTPAAAAGWDASIIAQGTGRFNDTPWNLVGGEDGTAPSVVVVPAEGAPGRRAIRFTLPAGASRAQLEPNTDNYVEGSDRWFRLSLRLAPGYPTDTPSVLADWKNDGDGDAPVELRVERGRFVLGGGAGYPGGARSFTRVLAPAVTGRTVDVLVHVRFSADPTRGSIDALVDGRPVVDGVRPPGGTLYPGNGGYRFGYWRIGPAADGRTVAPGVLDLTDARVGNSLTSVMSPTP